MTTAVSLFAGIGGFDLALERNGVEVVASVEWDKYAQSVLKKRFPNSQIHGDIREVTGEQLINAGFNPRNGIITGGFPCQDLSVAGKRAGLAGNRSGLFWEICRLLDETKAQYFILENVPGLLSSNSGADMGVVISALAERGYGLAYRVLDAQYFGVPQRRRRVFIVGCLGNNGGTPAEILSIAEGRAGYIEKDRKTRESITPTIDHSLAEDSELVLFAPHRADGARIQNKTVNTLAAYMGTGGNNVPMVAYSMHGAMIGRNDQAGPKGSGFFDENEPSYTLTSSSQARHGVVTVAEKESMVRRLTPLECERLQGFPDGWTEGQTDGHRYKQLGNAVAVPVVEWIISRMVEQINE
jgi:DNA (cytosine-5)-methyltransferase 1